MDVQQEQLLDDIRGLARTIREEFGIYVTYQENMHPDRDGDPGTLEVEVPIHTDPGSAGRQFTIIRGSTMPDGVFTVSLSEMRDELVGWLVERRKECAA